MVVRVAVAGRQNAPDLQTVMGILGKDKVLERVSKAILSDFAGMNNENDTPENRQDKMDNGE